jgi:transcriptional regulator with XRE-family HTH domain
MYLKEARKRKLFTQMDLSKQTGIDQSVLSLIENGYRSPSNEDVAKILNVLGYGPGEIIFKLKG